jgi:hypothetical protein
MGSGWDREGIAGLTKVQRRVDGLQGLGGWEAGRLGGWGGKALSLG